MTRWMSSVVRARSPLLHAVCLIAMVSGTSAAQAIDPPADTPAPAARSLAAQSQLSLTTCGRNVPSPQTELVFFDQHHNLWYRATEKGLNLTDSHRWRVIGGLLPTWNLAAQAGATDPGPTLTAIQWTLPNTQLGSSPYPPPKMRVSWIPSLSTSANCPAP